MSKIKVDIIEDSSGNTIRFPQNSLGDGYLKVSSTGQLSTVSALPSQTEFVTIYDADKDGVLSGTSIEYILTPEQVSKISAGARCILFFSNVSYMDNQGWQFISGTPASGSSFSSNSLYHWFDRSGGYQRAYGSFSYIPQYRVGFTAALATEMIGGVGVTEFQIANVNGDREHMTFKSISAKQYEGQSRYEYNRVEEVLGGALGPQGNWSYYKMVFPNTTVGYGGGISLIILGDE